MEFSYEMIKELAKHTGRRVTDLIALAAQNDPFYTGTPGEVALAEWFARFYHDFYGEGTKVHVRRCHYAAVSKNLILPNGKPYENTEECWNTILLATKAARYLRLVDVNAFHDMKHSVPIDHSPALPGIPDIYVNGYLYSDELKFPDFPGLPTFGLASYEPVQPYHIELWCEKTTMNDILEPLCQRYGMVLQTGAGELSITATKALAQRIERIGKPTRIFYISDYDPAGQSMPVAVSRKLEYFVRSEQIEADIRLFPVVLTAEQVRSYNLPRTPIKESERRKESFEARHGAGATELDALEALHPGELRTILRRYIESYFDPTLERRASPVIDTLRDNLRQVRSGVIERYEDQITAARDQLEAIKQDLGARMEEYGVAVQQLWQVMSDDMQLSAPDLDEYPLPEARPANEIGEGLYNSDRDYLEQIDVYKQFQGKQR